MKRTSLFRKILSVVFAATIVFTVSVREVHYLFSQHEAHEHCENHLHDSTHHEDCSVCKFDLSIFSDEILPSDNTKAIVFASQVDDWSQVFNLQSQISSVTLRGPPALA